MAPCVPTFRLRRQPGGCRRATVRGRLDQGQQSSELASLPATVVEVRRGSTALVTRCSVGGTSLLGSDLLCFLGLRRDRSQPRGLGRQSVMCGLYCRTKFHSAPPAFSPGHLLHAPCLLHPDVVLFACGIASRCFSRGARRMYFTCIGQSCRRDAATWRNAAYHSVARASTPIHHPRRHDVGRNVVQPAAFTLTPSMRPPLLYQVLSQSCEAAGAPRCGRRGWNASNRLARRHLAFTFMVSVRASCQGA